MCSCVTSWHSWLSSPRGARSDLHLEVPVASRNCICKLQQSSLSETARPSGKSSSGILSYFPVFFIYSATLQIWNQRWGWTRQRFNRENTDKCCQWISLERLRVRPPISSCLKCASQTDSPCCRSKSSPKNLMKLKRGENSLLVMSHSLMAFSAGSTTSRYIKSQDYGHVLIGVNNHAIGRVCEAVTFLALHFNKDNKARPLRWSGSSSEFLSHCAAAARIAP